MTNAIATVPLSLPPKSVVTMQRHAGESKELDSPMTTQTDVSSTYDDEQSVLNTPPPMTSRLGRIVVSSSMNCCTTSSTTDGSGSSSSSSSCVTDGFHLVQDESVSGSGSRTSSQRRRDIRRSANRQAPQQLRVNNQPNDESRGVLIGALHQLQRLATLDSTEYQQRLLENTLPSLQTEAPNPLYCPTLAKNPSATTQISDLSKTLQTPLVQLSMSIHRLHAAVANITRDVDDHTDEVQELQSRLEALQKRNQQVESVAKKVHKKNLKLKQQAQHDRKVAHGLKHKVQKYEAQLESQGFQLLASKVQQHEIQLQLSKTTQHSHPTTTGSEDGGPLRERVDSGMGDFLDIDDLQHDVSMLSHEAEFPSITKSSSYDDKDEHRCIRSDGSYTASSVSGKHGAPKKTGADSATSETSGKPYSPTFTFSKGGGVNADKPKSKSQPKAATASKSPARKTDVDEVRKKESSSTSPNKAPNSHKEQQPRVENHHNHNNVEETKQNLKAFGNRFAKFITAKSIPYYNLKIITPCNIQFAELPRSDEPNISPDSAKSLTVFAVCGLKDFNTEFNMKPTIGAQLTKINGVLIGEKCTLERLYAALEKQSGSGAKTTNNRSKHIVLTFRDEPWDAEQTRVLNTAIRRVAEGNTASAKSSPKEKPNGASVLESHQNPSSS